jgi:L-alanine-DL-glutamate epimerase-like enolase superfamily enzyme
MNSRRKFVKQVAGLSGLALTGIPHGFAHTEYHNFMKQNKITLKRVDSDFEREPLIRPFGFKGGYMSEIWQAVTMVESHSGIRKTGLGTQSVLWSDAEVFASNSEAGGNALMFAMTNYALDMIKGHGFIDPIELLDDIFDDVYEYGKMITGNPDLRKTFALNALVAVDNAAWLLYAEENNIQNFDDLIPETYKPALSHHHKKVASIPLMPYSIPIEEIKDAADQGYFFMKIKIGQPGSQSEMLKRDMERLTAIHKTIGHYETTHTKDGKLPYYFDANGRYHEKETLLRLLDHAKKIGAFDQIAIIEEPFPEKKDMLVGDIGVRIVADESAHTDKETLERIEMGYRAIALKGIAKTLSMTFKIATVAHDHDIPCFCADLTVNPILVDWNKNIAARLAPFPGVKLGLLETNGHQNYKNWDTIVEYHPYPDAPWRKVQQGVFDLDEDFYKKSGGIFKQSGHYMNMFNR